MDLKTVQQDIAQWIERFVEVPHPALGNWPPCPYARRARLNGTYQVQLGVDLALDLRNIADRGLSGMEVIVLAYNPKDISHTDFNQILNEINRLYLLPNNLLALEDHPDDPEIVNGVCMNQGTYALALVQSVSDLDAKARLMARQGFYDTWPEDYLQQLFHNRQDPRS